MSQHLIFLVLRRMRRPLIALILIYAIATFGLTLIPGIDPDGNTWHMSFFHAFYFVSFMGSTIGFGEIPYPFTDFQRYWVLCCIYTSVIAWLYTIGTLLSLLQDASFKQAVTMQRFSHAISKLNSPFFIICGYGDTGKTLTKELSALGYSIIVLDRDPNSLLYLPLDTFNTPIHSLICDVAIPENLVNAGLLSPYCQAIIALTDHDHTNLKVAVSTKSMRPELFTVCRAQDDSEIANLQSFNTDVICNPNEIFAQQLIDRISKPTVDSITHRIISQHNDDNAINQTEKPRTGTWIICGYGLFGQTVKSHLDHANIPVTIIEEQQADKPLPQGFIDGTGTEAATLESAGIHQAAGLIAGTNDDANNLSILLTAQKLNPTIYTIGRLNQKHNRSLYDSAKPHAIFRDHQVMADAILTRLTRPMVTEFLKQLDKLSENDAETLEAKINQLTLDGPLVTWRLILSDAQSPAIIQALKENKTIRIADLQKDIHTTPHSAPSKTSLCLLIKRTGQCEITPCTTTILQRNDHLLFCSSKTTLHSLQRISHDIELLDDQLNPSLPSIPLLRWRHRTRASNEQFKRSTN